MLRSPDPAEPLQQGDIVAEVPFLVLGKVVNVKAQGLQGQKRLDCQQLTTFGEVKTFAGQAKLTATDVPCVLQLGMIVTQSCDLDNKDFVTLARVFPLGDAVQQAKLATEGAEPLVLFDVVRRLTEGTEYNHLVYVSDPQNQGRQVADLLRVQSYPEVWKECFRQRRVKGLTDDGLRYLQGRLAAFTGRFATTSGFWQTDEDRALAAQLKANPSSLAEAHERLKGRLRRSD